MKVQNHLEELRMYLQRITKYTSIVQYESIRYLYQSLSILISAPAVVLCSCSCLLIRTALTRAGLSGSALGSALALTKHKIRIIISFSLRAMSASKPSQDSVLICS